MASQTSSSVRPKSSASSLGDSPAWNRSAISEVGTREPTITGRPKATAGSMAMSRSASRVVPASRLRVNGNSRIATPRSSRSMRFRWACRSAFIASCPSRDALISEPYLLTKIALASLQRLNEPAHDAERFRKDASFVLQHFPRVSTRPEHIHQLRQLILRLAFLGELISQNPVDESASILLERLASDSKTYCHQMGIAPPRPSPIDADSLPHPAPSGW